MSNKSWIDHSHIEYSSTEAGFPGVERVQLGCLQRIATAVEKVAEDRLELERRINGLQLTIERQRKRIAQKDRAIAAYRGIVTRLKKSRR